MMSLRSSAQVSRYSGPVPSASSWLMIATPCAGTGPGAVRYPASRASGNADWLIHARRSGSRGG